MKAKSVILFDGECNFCNSSVNFIISRDPGHNFFFTPLQSDKGNLLLREYHLEENMLQTFVLIEDDRAYTRSTAALKVCRQLTGGWPLFYGFIIVPRFIRDGLYNWVASNRYKWFGKREQCMIPTPDVKSRFLG